jgi:hypothetical protein
MADRNRRNQDDDDDKPDKAPTARPLTPGQREAHRRDVDREHDAQRAEAERRQAEALREQGMQAEQSPPQALPPGAPSEGPPPEDIPPLAAMTLSEMYDALLDAVVERVRAAIRSQAPDYQELACRLVIAPQVTFTLRREGDDA